MEAGTEAEDLSAMKKLLEVEGGQVCQEDI